MAKVDLTIKGVTPLLMHRYPLGESEGFEKWPDDKKAEWAAYRDGPAPDGELIIPAEAMYRCLVSAGSYSKGKRGSNLSRIVAGSLNVTPAALGLGVTTYAIDIRNVRIKATQGVVPRVRPRLDAWGTSFAIEWDDTLMTERQVREIVDAAGRRVGILDYRPERKGPFGRFMVTAWTMAA